MMTLALPRLSVLPFLLALGCGGGADVPKAAAGDDSAASQGGPAGAAAATDRWTVQFTEDISASGLVATVETTATCCGDQDSEAAGSPARLYLSRATGGAGFLLFLGTADAVVLAGQTGQGVYGTELYRSSTPATRDTAVTLTVPIDALPGGDLRVWAATRTKTTVAGKDLALKLDDGSIPCAILETGKPGGPESGVLPENQEPNSGDPTRAADDGVAPPPDQAANSGDPTKAAEDDAPPPPGQDPKTGDPAAPPSDGPAPPTGQQPKTGDPALDEADITPAADSEPLPADAP